MHSENTKLQTGKNTGRNAQREDRWIIKCKKNFYAKSEMPRIRITVRSNGLPDTTIYANAVNLLPALTIVNFP